MTDPFASLFALDQFGIKFGLENIRAILQALGNPEQTFHSIHIAGTNGKGSVTAMIDACLRAAGHRVGRYTSPHLVDLNERFVIDGQPIDTDRLRDTLTDVEQTVARLRRDQTLAAQPTFFEVTTAVAFELFRRANVTVAVCEVGLGGRLDATNVLTPLVTAITSIDFDHEKYLGTTIEAIATEKAGIIKPGVPLVVGPLPPDALDVVRRIAGQRRAPLVLAERAAAETRRTPGSDGTRTLRLRTAHHDYGEVRIGLPGQHQIANAVVAVSVLEQLDNASVRISPDSIVEGLTQVSWPGRLDVRRLSGGREALLDAAHNPSGASTLAQFMNEEGWAGVPLVFAAMRDKNIAQMLGALLPSSGHVVVTRATNARSAEPETIATIIQRLAPGHVYSVEPNLSQALASAWRLSSKIVIAGSLFLLGDVLEELKKP